MAVYISKSRYCAAIQCPKMLWLKVNKPEEFDDSVMNQVVLDTGNAVGDLAMGLFGDFVEVPFDHDDLGGMCERTTELLEEGTPVIAEASFSFEGKFCSVDILRNIGGNAVELYEVKSSTGAKPLYYHDISFQYYVLTGLGYDVRRACLVHIDKTYVRRGVFEKERFFRIVDVTEEVSSMRNKVGDRLTRLDRYMEQEEEPSMKLGTRCHDPYPCGFFRYCKRDLPSPNIFDISRVKEETKIRCYEKGIISFEDIELDGGLNRHAMRQVEFALYGKPLFADREALSCFLGDDVTPRCYLSMLCFNPAVPLYDDSRPYEMIPYGWSLLIEEGEERRTEEFLGTPSRDPRREAAERLCKAVPAGSRVLVYGANAVKYRLRRLAELYPDLAADLNGIQNRLEDLSVPFMEGSCYDGAMEGSYGMDKVLSALFPGDSSRNYSGLDTVQNGEDAAQIFAGLESMEEEELLKSRERLGALCRFETFAAAEIRKSLVQMCK